MFTRGSLIWRFDCICVFVICDLTARARHYETTAKHDGLGVFIVINIYLYSVIDSVRGPENLKKKKTKQKTNKQTTTTTTTKTKKRGRVPITFL